MNKLYIFAIGGSGERVLKSLILTLASGANINAQEVIPVIVDNDEKSAALIQCQNIIKHYGTTEGDNGLTSIYKKAFGEDSTQWPTFCHTNVREPIMLNVAGGSIGNLRTIINLPSQSNRKEDEDNNKLIRSLEIETDLLFSKDDLEMPLNVGFVGNPNIGSVVLKSMSLSDDAFTAILNSVTSNDGVIVVGSLFGGTGAAGFPLIINHFKQIQNKPILGAIAVLPYFKTNKSKSVDTKTHIDTVRWNVHSETFETKTRAALMYYDDYMEGVDYLYYAGDDKPRTYPHSVGGTDQDNPAHLVELLSAMSIIDFAKQTSSTTTTYKRPIWSFVAPGDSVSNVSCITNENIRRSMVKFQLMEELLKSDELLKYAIETLKAKFVTDLHFTDEIRVSSITDGAIKHTPAIGLNGLLKDWDAWMSQLSDNEATRQLHLFDHTKKLTRENVTQNFCSEGGEFGIAKTEQVRKGGMLGFGGTIVTQAINPKILDEMVSVYNTLPQSMKMNVSENQKLAYELLIISKALDNVLDNKCAI